eukprot:6980860-Pyramimonas_sp.AAC.1
MGSSCQGGPKTPRERCPMEEAERTYDDDGDDDDVDDDDDDGLDADDNDNADCWEGRYGTTVIPRPSDDH